MKYVLVLFSPLLFILSYLYPKDNNLWVYGAWFGKRYADNSKALFEYANNHGNKEVQNVWIYKDSSLKPLIEKMGYKALHAYSFNGIKTQLQARVFITSVNSSDFLPFILSPRNVFIQLWHGSPLKHIGVDSRKSQFRKLTDTLRFRTLDCYSLVISPSGLFDEIFSLAFKTSPKKIFRSGYPRNEKLIVNKNRVDEIRKDYCIKDNEIFAAYLPTHRNEGMGENPFRKVLSDLIGHNEYLQKKGLKILVKPHYYEKDSLNDLEGSSNVLIEYDLPMDLYELLGATDKLITDYSSVMFDYEILNKEIHVFPFDLENYVLNDRSLYFSFDYIYDNLKNVQKASSLNQLLENLTKGSSKQLLTHKDRSVFNESFDVMTYSSSIYNEILKLVSSK